MGSGLQCTCCSLTWQSGGPYRVSVSENDHDHDGRDRDDLGPYLCHDRGLAGRDHGPDHGPDRGPADRDHHDDFSLPGGHYTLTDTAVWQLCENVIKVVDLNKQQKYGQSKGPTASSTAVVLCGIQGNQPTKPPS